MTNSLNHIADSSDHSLSLRIHTIAARLLGSVLVVSAAVLACPTRVQAVTDGNDSGDKKLSFRYYDNLSGLADYALNQVAVLLAKDESTLELARSLVDCALDHTDEIVVSTGGHTYHLKGRLNLAPGWSSDPLTQADRKLVSACVMAHVNYYSGQLDINVVMDARGPDRRADGDAGIRFSSYEGTFYGDLFADSPTMYACTGDTAPDFSVAFPDHDPTVGDRLLRRCTDDNGSGITMCGFTYTGSCQTVCDTNVDGSYTDCWGGDKQYEATISIWLLAYDDMAAIWAEFYHEIFG